MDGERQPEKVKMMEGSAALITITRRRSPLKNPLAWLFIVGSFTVGAMRLWPSSGADAESRRGVSDVWMEEVEARLQETTCSFASTSERRAFESAWEETLSLCRARARLSPAAPLEAAYEIQGWLSCGAGKDFEGRADFTAARAELLERVRRSVAIEVARLRRAQVEKQEERALRAIERLQQILAFHQGHVSERLRSWAASYRAPERSRES